MFPNIEFCRGFIGDKYTLCKDLPDKYVLQNGYVYRLLGSSTVLEMQTSMPHNLGSLYPMYKIMTLDTPSPLYEKLCNVLVTCIYYLLMYISAPLLQRNSATLSCPLLESFKPPLDWTPIYIVMMHTKEHFQNKLYMVRM